MPPEIPPRHPRPVSAAPGEVPPLLAPPVLNEIPNAEPRPNRIRLRVPLRNWRPAAAIFGVLVVGWLGISLLPGARESRKDFARLCEMVLPSMAGGTEIIPSGAERLLDAKRRETDLVRIASGHGELSRIAQQLLDQKKAALGILSEGSSALATGIRGGIENSMAERSQKATGPSSGDAKIWEGVVGLLKQGINTAKLAGDVQTIGVSLAKLAPRFSRNPDDDFAVDGSFSEEAPGPFEKLVGQVHSDGGVQQLWLTQRQSKLLHDCVIVVRLIRPNAESFLHCYFIREWRQGEGKTAVFTTGFAGDSDPAVNRVAFQIFAREQTSPEMQISRTGSAWPYFKQ